MAIEIETSSCRESLTGLDRFVKLFEPGRPVAGDPSVPVAEFLSTPEVH